MRRAAKVDANQPEIVAALRKSGCSVEHLHSVGGGVPDLLVGVAGLNLLLEVKDGAKPPSARKLTPDQVEWHGKWLGHKAVVSTVEEALEAVESFLCSHGRNVPPVMTDMLIALRGSNEKSLNLSGMSSAPPFPASLSRGSRKNRTRQSATPLSTIRSPSGATIPAGRAASSKR